jgi:hypothetical protein
MTEAELRDITGVGASARLIRSVLAVGSAFFLVSGALLFVVPDSFAVWIGLEPSDAVAWTLRMLGVVLMALAGQMWLVRRARDHPVLGAGAVMMVASALLTGLTVTLPGEWTPLRWALLGAGAVFALAYLGLLIASRRL